MREQFAAFRAILDRDFRMYMSFRTALGTQAMSMVFTLALFYFVSRLVAVDRLGSPDDYFAYVAVGLVIISVLHSGLALATTLQSELVAGTFERLLLSPFGPVLATMAMTLFPMTRALLMAVWTLTVAAIVFGLDLHWSTAALALPLGLLCAAAFGAIALAIAAAVVAFKRAPGIGFVLAGIALVSGIYFPVDELPSWIRWLSDVQPFTPAVNLLRHVLVGLPMPDPAWEYLLKLGGFTIVALPVAGWAIDRAVLYAHRRGTLLEY
jgi:ABC-type polysaccharide/polyol phosphate export permease